MPPITQPPVQISSGALAPDAQPEILNGVYAYSAPSRLYQILKGATLIGNTRHILMLKSTDGGATWARMDQAGDAQPDGRFNVGSFQDGNVIYNVMVDATWHLWWDIVRTSDTGVPISGTPTLPPFTGPTLYGWGTHIRLTQ